MISNLERNLQRFVDESMKKGKVEGKREGEKERSLEIAKRMLLKGMAKEDISELTKLTMEEIEELANSMK